jgi:hypothetical protein
VGSSIAFRCPVHADGHASGSLSEGDDGRALLHCHAGCSCEEIVERIGLTMADLFDEEPKAERRIVATYDYADEAGTRLYQVVRFVPKDFRQRRPDGSGGWAWDMKNVRRVLYRLPDLLETAKNGGTIYVVEGERDADAINAGDPDSAGRFIATCNPGGAGKWRAEYAECLRGASKVVIVADKDEPGRRHALDVRASLRGIINDVRIVEAKVGKDAADHLAAGHRLDELLVPQGPSAEAIAPIDLHDPSIVGVRPEFTVKNLIRRAGLHLAWAEPSAGKTWTLARWLHELLVDTGCGRLAGHPELWINRRLDRVLWIATEEDASTMKYKVDWICRGLDIDPPRGKFMYLYAAQSGRRITIDDLPELLAASRYDVVVLDSLTGLRPKTVAGERVRWDIDNDAANELCLRLRGLATEYQVAIVLIHHTGRDTTKGYRGPTDWWASADVMFGFVPDGGRTKVIVEKNRDGKRVPPFYLTPSWDGDVYTLAYDGAATEAKLTPTATKVLAWFRGTGQATQARAINANLGGRSTVQDAIAKLLEHNLIRDLGTKVNGSPLYAWVPEGAGDETGTLQVEK